MNSSKDFFNSSLLFHFIELISFITFSLSSDLFFVLSAFSFSSEFIYHHSSNLVKIGK